MVSWINLLPPKETHSDTEIEAIMKDPTGVGKTLLSDLDKHRMGYSYGPGISHICFYMALCCVINKTETCKPLLDSLAKACYISVDNYASLEVKYEKPKEIKYILKEIVKRMIDEYGGLISLYCVV